MRAVAEWQRELYESHPEQWRVNGGDGPSRIPEFAAQARRLKIPPHAAKRLLGACRLPPGDSGAGAILDDVRDAVFRWVWNRRSPASSDILPEIADLADALGRKLRAALFQAPVPADRFSGVFGKLSEYGITLDDLYTTADTLPRLAMLFQAASPEARNGRPSTSEDVLWIVGELLVVYEGALKMVSRDHSRAGGIGKAWRQGRRDFLCAALGLVMNEPAAKTVDDYTRAIRGSVAAP